MLTLVWVTVVEVVMGLVTILVATKMLMIVEWILTDMFNLKTLEVDILHMGLPAMVLLVMDMVPPPIMAWAMVGMLGMGVETRDMGPPQVLLLMGTRIIRVLQGAHGMHKLPLGTGQLGMEMPGLGLLRVPVVVGQQVSLLVGLPLAMEVKAMDMAMGLMEVRLTMEVQEVVVGIHRGIRVAMEVGMVMPMVMEDMGLRLTELMLLRWVMVVVMVGPKIDRVNSSKF